MPPFLPLAPDPQRPASINAIERCGARSFRASAVHSPVKPPPTIATSTAIRPESGAESGRPFSALRASLNHHDGSPGATLGRQDDEDMADRLREGTGKCGEVVPPQAYGGTTLDADDQTGGLNSNLDQNIVSGQAQPDGDQNLTG